MNRHDINTVRKDIWANFL